MTKSSHCHSLSLIGCLTVICVRGASQKKADSTPHAQYVQPECHAVEI